MLLASAVKGSDGFFTTFFVSTWSRYVARWAARARASRPNQVTVIALCIGIAGGGRVRDRRARRATSRAPCSLYLSFVVDCVDGQLARYTRRFSKFGAWLDSVFDRAKEYVGLRGPRHRRRERGGVDARRARR